MVSIGIPTVNAELKWVRTYPDPNIMVVEHHSLTFIESSGTALLFGGDRGEEPPFDYERSMYEYDGQQWMRIRPFGEWPEARDLCGLSYDPVRNIVVLFGGYDWAHPFDYFGDTWEWNGESWIEIQTNEKPLDRASHTMCYFESLGSVVLFGGFNDTTFERMNDTWLFDGFEWTDISPAVRPPIRSATQICYRLSDQRCYVYGGADENSMSRSDFWAFDGTEWEELTPEHSPGPRDLHTMCYDESRDRIVLFGGIPGSGWAGDTWEYDGTDWIRMHGDRPGLIRAAQAMCYDSVRERMIMCGGSNVEYMDDTWEYYDVPPTPTVTHTPSPSPTATATPLDGIMLALHLPEEPIHAGDTFYLDVNIHNANPDPLTDIPLFVILEAAGSFWYHPAWSMEPAWETLSIIPTGPMGITILEAFEWPGNAGTGTARFWGALTDEGMSRILGDYDVKDFSWE